MPSDDDDAMLVGKEVEADAAAAEAEPNERAATWPSWRAAVCLTALVEPVSRSEMSRSRLRR